MNKILFLVLFGLNFCNAYSQTEWKFIVGRHITPVSLTRRGIDGSYSTISGSTRFHSGYKSVQNQGYLDVGGCFGGKGVRFEFALGVAFYEETFKLTLDSSYRVNGGDYIYGEIAELERSVKNQILPNVRLSSNFSIGKKNILKLMLFNQSLSAWNAGLCLERRFSKKFLVSAIVFMPVSSLEPYYSLDRKIGGGIQMSYVFARKEKLKKGKSNSSPTVL